MAPFRGMMQLWIGITIGLTANFLFTAMIQIVPSRTVRFEQTFFSPKHTGHVIGEKDTTGLAPGASRDPQELEDLHERFEKYADKHPAGDVKFEDTHAHHDDDTLAKELYDKERVLCWIMTSPQNLKEKARVVRDTWAKRCNKMLFISSETNPDFPTIGLNVSEGRRHLTSKTMKAFKLIYEKYIDEADWFMKADDDTYVILENLRYFLTSFKKMDPVYFGHHFRPKLNQGYYSGGGGYVLSKEALIRLGRNGTDRKLCRQDGGSEDAQIGLCMEKLGVRTVNSTDSLGRSRFHCFTPTIHMNGLYPNWYYRYDANGANMGITSVSDYAISFHYISPEKMYDMEFFIYHLRPYGIVYGSQELNRKPKDQEVHLHQKLKKLRSREVLGN